MTSTGEITEDEQDGSLRTLKELYDNNCFIGFAHHDAVRRAPHLAAQQKLGLLPERWPGIDRDDPDCPVVARQNLNGAADALQTKGEKCYET